MASCLSWDGFLFKLRYDTIPVLVSGAEFRILRVTYDRQTNLMTGWKRETKEGVGMTSVLAINRSMFFLSQTFESWRLGHVRRTSDRASACTQAPRMFYRLVICFLSGCTLFIWLVSNSCYFYSFFIFTILIFLQSWIWSSFCQSFCSVFSFSISRDTLYIHLFGPLSNTANIFDKIEQNHGARLMSPLTVTVKPLSLQTSERHFSFLFFLVVKECVWLDSSKGIAEKEWNNTKKFVYKAW